MNTPLLTTSKVTPRLMYIALLSALFAAAIGDHLISPSLTNLAAPAEHGNACAHYNELNQKQINRDR